MSEKVKEKALKYYPAQWSDAYLRALVKKGALTKDEYKEVTGHDYETTTA